MSNIVLVRPTAMDPETLSAALEKLGVLVLPFGPSVRLVTHREIDDNAVEETLHAFRSARNGDD
jgi:threonine aldolase